MDTKRGLLLICTAALLLRLLLASQSGTLEYSAYETVREVEHIRDTGLPLLHDELSWGGRTIVSLPVFPYLLAFGTLLMPEQWAYLILPNFFAVLLHAALFGLILELTNDARLALLGAAASIFIPTYLGSTLLTLSSLSLALPIFVYSVTLFLKLRKTQEKRNLLLALFIVLSFTNAIALLYIPFLILSLAINTIKRARGETAQQEFAIFAIFFLLWFNALLYKPALLKGLDILHGGVPEFARIGSSLSFIELAVAVGVVPFALALYAAYKEATGNHVGIQTVVALVLATVILLWTDILPLETGLSLLGAGCVALGAVGIQYILKYRRVLRRSIMPTAVIITLSLLFVLTSFVATATTAMAVEERTAHPDVLEAAAWLRDNSPTDSMVLTLPRWGFVFESVAERPVYLDENYLGRTDAEERYAFVTDLLTLSASPAQAERRHIDYVITDRPIDHPCLRPVHNTTVVIEKVLCP